MTVACIAGMHRSGTSALARMLNLAGLYLGEQGDLLGASPFNPEGHWENVHFLNINESLLAHLNGAWDLPPRMPAGWVQQPWVAPLRQAARELITSFSRHAAWGWKDPRNTLTLSFWSGLIPGLRLVACLRHPLEVAQSLSVRGASSTAFSLNLWRVYNTRLQAAVEEGSALITHYDALLYDSQVELQRILDFLQLPVTSQALTDAGRSANVALKHHRSPSGDSLGLERYPEIAALYSRLCEQAGPNYRRAVREDSRRQGLGMRWFGQRPENGATPADEPAARTGDRGPTDIVHPPSVDVGDVAGASDVADQAESRPLPDLGAGSEPLVSVVIANHNGENHLGDCLGSLGELDLPANDLEIIVVDNASQDASLHFIRSEFPRVRVIGNRRNVGFSIAANQGAGAARGRYVAFLNTDMRVRPDWLAPLLQAIQAEPEVACVGSRIMDWDGLGIDYFGRTDDLFQLNPQPAASPSAVPDLDTNRYSMFASSGAMLIRKDVFDDLGRFDGRYFMYHEDVDLGWRLWLKGWRCVLAPRSVVLHKGKATSRKLPSDFVHASRLQNMLATVFKNLGTAGLEQLLPVLLYFLLEQRLIRPAVGTALPGLLREFDASLDALVGQRNLIQSTRVITDNDLFSRFQHPFAFLLDSPSYQVVRQRIVDGFPGAVFDPRDVASVRACLTGWLNAAYVEFIGRALHGLNSEQAGSPRLDHQLQQRDQTVQALSRNQATDFQLSALQNELQSIKASRSWRLARALGAVYRRFWPRRPDRNAE